MKVRVVDYPNMYTLVRVFSGAFSDGFSVGKFSLQGSIDIANNRCTCVLKYKDAMFLLMCSITGNEYFTCNSICECLAKRFIKMAEAKIIQKTSIDKFRWDNHYVYFSIGNEMYRTPLKYKVILDHEVYRKYTNRNVFYDGYNYSLEKLCESGMLLNTSADSIDTLCETFDNLQVEFEPKLSVSTSDYPYMRALVVCMTSLLGSYYRLVDFSFTGIHSDFNHSCVLRYKDDFYYLDCSLSTHPARIRCNAICEELAKEFVEQVGEQIILPSCEEDIQNHKEDWFYRVDGKIYRVSGDYPANVVSQLYKECNYENMIWQGRRQIIIEPYHEEENL